MITYSVSIIVNKEIEKEWLKYMNEVHIKDVMEKKCFEAFNFRQEIDDSLQNTSMYNIEYQCETIDKFEFYQKNYASDLQKEHSDLFMGKFAASRKIYRTL